MIKNLIVVIVLIFTTGVFAKTKLCKTSDECKKLELSTIAQKKVVDEKLAQIKRKIFMFDAAKEVSWVESNGAKWSTSLPGKYANCISIKDAGGNPVISEFETVACERKSGQSSSIGSYKGTSDDQKQVIDSDAIQACKDLGARLLTKDDVSGFREVYDKIKPKDGSIEHTWTTMIHDLKWYEAVTVLGFEWRASSFSAGRGSLRSVHCIMDESTN